MRIFFFIWLGQVVSLLGSKLTEFVLGVWVYRQTESLTQFAFVILCMYLPNLLVSPFAGALLDRWDRRWIMILNDLTAGATTLAVMALLWSNSLQVWHVYLAVAVISCADAFQIPAYAAAIPQLVPKEQLGRANGMVQIAKAISKISAPLLAGFLLEFVALKDILLVDFCTFIVAAITLLLVRFPAFTTDAIATREEGDRIWQEMMASWRYIAEQPGLPSLLGYIATIYFTIAMLEVLFYPFILNFASSATLGRILSIGGCGMLLGSLTISIWGGSQRRIYSIFSFVPLQGIALLLGGWYSSLYLSALAIFMYLFAQPVIISCNRAIWQSKIPLHLQGRIFAWQNILERSLAVLAYLIAGPLVEKLLEPMMAADGLLADSIGKLIGVGEGRGMGLLLCMLGVGLILATIVACQLPQLRQIEEEDTELLGIEARSPS